MSTCLVTGAAGFIGINLCKTLLDQGCCVIGIDNLSTSTKDELMEVCKNYKNFTFYNLDFADYNLTFLYDIDFETVYHLGGMSGVRESIEYPDIWFKNNVVGTFNILEFVRKTNITNVVIASSSAAIGDVNPPINEELPMKPISPYGASKGFKELYTSAYYHSYGINTSSLRFSNVYGPHSTIKKSLVAKFIRKIIKGEPLQIYGSGDQTRDFIYVTDLVDAIILAGNSRFGGEIFQISTCVETSVNDITKLICDIMKTYGFDTKKIEYTEPAAGDILTNYADNSKAKKLLNWNPIVKLNDGLNETIKWFINEAKI